jgi:hypothetical protein
MVKLRNTVYMMIRGEIYSVNMRTYIDKKDILPSMNIFNNYMIPSARLYIMTENIKCSEFHIIKLEYGPDFLFIRKLDHDIQNKLPRLGKIIFY